MIIITGISILVCLVTIFLTMFLTSFLFIQDYSATKSVFKNAVEVSISRKKQSEIISQSTKLLNTIFKEIITEVVQTKDATLQEELKISKKDVKSFKQELNKILKEHEDLISVEAMKKRAKQTRQFDFFNLIKANTRFYSNNKNIALSKSIELYNNGKITFSELSKSINDIEKLDDVKARQYIATTRHKDVSKLFKFSNLVTQIFDISNKKKDTIKFVYSAWDKAPTPNVL